MKANKEIEVLHVGRSVMGWRVIVEAVLYAAKMTDEPTLRYMARDLNAQLPVKE